MTFTFTRIKNEKICTRDHVVSISYHFILHFPLSCFLYVGDQKPLVPSTNSACLWKSSFTDGQAQTSGWSGATPFCNGRKKWQQPGQLGRKAQNINHHVLDKHMVYFLFFFFPSLFLPFFAHTSRLAASLVSDQGLKLDPELTAWNPNHWTTRSGEGCLFFLIFENVIY